MMWRPVKRIVERLPMMKTLDLMYMASPTVGRAVTRVWYQHMTRMDKKAQMVFMNYGYADLDPGCTGLELATADEEDRYCIQLYHHVAGAVDIEGHDVLEIGCGRGGGASYVARYLRPNSMTGIDIAAEAVEFCRRHYSVGNLRFEHGDAEALPFEDGSFDTVVNVESSHCYASMPRFLAEVRRALRPGGWLLLADRRDRNGVDTLRNHLVNAGFEVVREKRITDNILRALDLDEERKQALIRRGVPWFLRNMFRQFAATRGTSLYNSFDKGGWEYFSFVLRKTEAAE